MNRDELLNDYNELKLLDAEKKDLIDLLFKKLGDRERLLRERGERIAELEAELAAFNRPFDDPTGKYDLTLDERVAENSDRRIT